jgi:hypothetical protein
LGEAFVRDEPLSEIGRLGKLVVAAKPPDQESLAQLAVPEGAYQAGQGILAIFKGMLGQQQVFELVKRRDTIGQGLKKMTPAEKVVHDLPVPNLAMGSGLYGLPTGRLAHGPPLRDMA